MKVCIYSKALSEGAAFGLLGWQHSSILFPLMFGCLQRKGGQSALHLLMLRRFGRCT